MRIKATPFWLARSLAIPGLGVVRRSPGSFEVPDDQGEWLIRHRYAKRLDVPVPEPLAPTEETSEDLSEDTPPPRTVSAAIVEFCNAAEVTDLTAIKGISPTTAKAIVDARDPDLLTEVVLLSLLNDRQLAAIEKHLV